MKRFFLDFGAVPEPVEGLATSPKKQSVSLFSVLFLVLILSSCSSYRKVAVVEHSVHDTLYLNKVQYDSVYVYQNVSTDRLHDTVYIRDIQHQYKYKLLRDTIREISIDSIPVIHEVQVTKTVKSIPTIYRISLWTCIGLIVLIILFILLKLFLK